MSQTTIKIKNTPAGDQVVRSHAFGSVGHAFGMTHHGIVTERGTVIHYGGGARHTLDKANSGVVPSPRRAWPSHACQGHRPLQSSVPASSVARRLPRPRPRLRWRLARAQVETPFEEFLGPHPKARLLPEKVKSAGARAPRDHHKASVP